MPNFGGPAGAKMKIGDICPECGDSVPFGYSVPFGQAAVVDEEGCRKCYACGFSEC